MKQVSFLLTFICFVGIVFSAEALDVNKKFGKPTDEEMNMTVYAPDPDAEAVKLYSGTDVSFDFTTQDLVVVYRVKERIKVLKPEGTSAADVVIIFFDPRLGTVGDRTISDHISNVRGSAYNLEDGKVVRSKLTGDLKTKERIDDNYCQVKFSIPNVKVGTVIEYEFQRQSPHISTISDWYAQSSRPVFFTEYNITIPEWFDFSTEQRGRASITNTRKDDSFKTVVGGDLLSCNAVTYHFEGRELPSIKDDEYIWCVEDYMSKVEHDLRSVAITGDFYRNYQSTWADVDKMLLGDAEFGKQFNMDNPLAKEQADLHLDGLSAKEKTEKLRDLLLAYYKWDKTFGLFGLSAKKLQKEGSANSCTLNFALMSMLKDAGVSATPVVLSRRSKGRLPYAHASVAALNTMVLAVGDAADSTVFFVDAAAKGYPVGSLLPNEMVDRGRILSRSGKGGWIDLRKSGEGKVVNLVRATVSPEGEMKGNVNTAYHGIAAGDFRDIYSNKTDSLAFVQQLATARNVEIEEYSLEGIDGNGDEVKEVVSFTRNLDTDAEHIYLNPFLFIDATNDFKAESRDLPVEFPYPITERRTVQIALPEGYEVEELPTSCNFLMPDEKMTCRMRIRQAGNAVSLSYNFARSTLLYDIDNYTYLRDFSAAIESKCNEMIVLKKKE